MQRKQANKLKPKKYNQPCLPIPDPPWLEHHHFGWLILLLWLGNNSWSGKNVFKFSEHFLLALSICSYHSGVGVWQGLELTYTKLCMSWSQPQWLCHCHIKLHHSWPLSACAHDTCQKLSSVCSFLHQDCLGSLDKEEMTFRMREGWTVPPLSASSNCQLGFSVNIPDFRSGRLVI